MHRLGLKSSYNKTAPNIFLDMAHVPKIVQDSESNIGTCEDRPMGEPKARESVR